MQKTRNMRSTTCLPHALDYSARSWSERIAERRRKCDAGGEGERLSGQRELLTKHAQSGRRLIGCLPIRDGTAVPLGKDGGIRTPSYISPLYLSTILFSAHRSLVPHLPPRHYKWSPQWTTRPSQTSSSTTDTGETSSASPGIFELPKATERS